jgi:hypothetical protein
MTTRTAETSPLIYARVTELHARLDIVLLSPINSDSTVQYIETVSVQIHTREGTLKIPTNAEVARLGKIVQLASYFHWLTQQH